mgnify:CR=1 FL=1
MGKGGNDMNLLIKGLRRDPCGIGTVQYFDCGGSFTGIYICQKQSNSTLQMGDSFACTLYLNKVDFFKKHLL